MIIFNPRVCKHKNGFFMICIDAYSTRCKEKWGVYISKEFIKSNLEKYQLKLINKFLDKLNITTPVVKSFRDNGHPTELKSDLAFGLTIYLTDISNVGGNAVGEDGAYIEYKGNLYALDDINGKYR